MWWQLLLGCIESDERETGACVLSTVLWTAHRVRHAVARWRAESARAVQQQSPQLTRRQMKRLMKRQKKEKRGRERGLARARWAGLRRMMVQSRISNWVRAVGDQWIKRAAALVAAAVDVEAVLCRRVWQELVDSFYWWHVGRAVVEETALVERRSGGHGGGSGDRVAYDWACTRCGWGGQLVKAGHATCRKCEWQGFKWCDDAASLGAEDSEDAVESAVAKQQEFAGRRVGDRLKRRMRLELGRLQGMLDEKRLGMWQQQVLETVQVGLQQGDTGDVRKLIAGALDAAVGVKMGGVWLPKPRLRQSAKEYVVGEVQAADEGSGWPQGCQEAAGGKVVHSEGLQKDSGSFQFLSQRKNSVDKTGRLPDWCEGDADKGEDARFEALTALEAVAADGLVAAEVVAAEVEAEMKAAADAVAAADAEELRMRWRVVAVLWSGRAALAQMKTRMRVRMRDRMAMMAGDETVETMVEADPVVEVEAALQVYERVQLEVDGQLESMLETTAQDTEAELAAEVAAAELAAAELAVAEVAAAEVAAAEVVAAEVAAEVTAMIQEAEFYGHEMTVAEAVWRHEMLLEEEQQWQRCACGDAASPQGKQHRLRSRTKKKKKKKKK